MHRFVDRNAPDYKDIYSSCDHFATQGNETAIYPKVVKDNDPELYAKTYPELLGTKFEKKSPDFKVGDHFYELRAISQKSLIAEQSEKCFPGVGSNLKG